MLHFNSNVECQFLKNEKSRSIRNDAILRIMGQRTLVLRLILCLFNFLHLIHHTKNDIVKNIPKSLQGLIGSCALAANKSCLITFRTYG